MQEQQEFEQYAYQVAVDRFQQYDHVLPEAKAYFNVGVTKLLLL